MSNKMEKITIAMEDREFVARIAAMEEPEDVQRAFAEKGVDFSLEEISQIAEMVMSSNSEELEETQLDAVSGGAVWEVVVVVAGLIKVGADIMTEVNKNRKAAGKKTIW